VDQKYHIAIIISENKISLFVDGELDNELIRTGKMNWNDGPLYIGESPGVAGLEITIENMNFYDYPLSVNQIRLDMGNKSDSPFSMVSPFGKGFLDLFLNEIGTDCELICQEKTLKVHKTILMNFFEIGSGI
jgi:hypothetical protein